VDFTEFVTMLTKTYKEENTLEDLQNVCKNLMFKYFYIFLPFYKMYR